MFGYSITIYVSALGIYMDGWIIIWTDEKVMENSKFQFAVFQQIEFQPLVINLLAGLGFSVHHRCHHHHHHHPMHKRIIAVTNP